MQHLYKIYTTDFFRHWTTGQDSASREENKQESPTIARTSCRESPGVPLAEHLRHQGKTCRAEHWKWQPTPDSCLGTPMDREARQAPVHRSQSRTRLSDSYILHRARERGGGHKGRVLQSSPEASAEQCIHLRRLPKGGEEPPERSKW